MNYLAWVILAAFYISVVMPILGSEMSNNKFLSYTESLKIGAAFHIVLGGFLAVMTSVLWATYYVMEW